ncbi:DegT/DnrJ/EryC1/StrS family aminotransferase [Rheinheimera sp.]|uniref:DegT/DnrJ/EryC1/StrS family aminotransferase n=1 Tax=Rheinheimera sp. TaxID=1869214 RepID=UPI003AF833D9
MIQLNKPYLPTFTSYSRYLDKVYSKGWLTNNGPMAQELKVRLEDYLGVKNLLPVANGTLAMQLAYKVFDLKGEAVTTPFTFIATSSSLAWEGIRPRFADVDPNSYNLNAVQCEPFIRQGCNAVVPVHVYGNPCDVHAFETLRERHKVRVIYDAAHAFGIKVSDNSVLNYGDASTLSFHATKVFHTVEGGAVIFRSSDDYERAVMMTNFGIDVTTGQIPEQGINTKISEVHAAMGLAVLDDIEKIMERRQALYQQYRHQLHGIVQQQGWHPDATENGAYMPVSFENATLSEFVMQQLQDKGIMSRRYFSPSINKLEQYSEVNADHCPVSESLATRTLCLPLYYDLTEQELNQVTAAVKQAVYAFAD